MALKKREKQMVALTAVLVVVFGVVLLFRGGNSPGGLRTKHAALVENIEKQKKEAEPGVKAAATLAAWRKRALPENVSVAQGLYNRWLSDLAIEKAGFSDTVVTPQTQQPRSVYTVLPFQVEGRATLGQLTKFLFGFYSANFLHKIETLNIAPSEGGNSLKLTIRIQALSLPGAVAKDSLPTVPSTRLQHAELADYEKVILSRKMDETEDPNEGEGPYRTVESAAGLFALYTEPPTPPDKGNDEGVKPWDQPPPPPPPQPFDHSRYTYVSAINEIDGQREVWLFVRTLNQTLKLHEGDPFEVGLMSGKITEIRIDERDVEIETADGRRRVAIGSGLQDHLSVPGILQRAPLAAAVP